MRITFGKNDPRAGMTAEVPADIARSHIESGAARESSASEVKASDAAASEPVPAVEVRAPARAVRESDATAKKAPARKAAKKAR